MNVEVTLPEGKTSFTGIPESQFIDDVDSYMKGEDSAEAKIKSFDEVCPALLELDCNVLFRFTRSTNSWKTVSPHAGKD